MSDDFVCFQEFIDHLAQEAATSYQMKFEEFVMSSADNTKAAKNGKAAQSIALDLSNPMKPFDNLSPLISRIQ